MLLRVIVAGLLVLATIETSEAQVRRRFTQPPSQGFFLPSYEKTGGLHIELRGLRVPVRVTTPEQQRMLEMAYYWTVQSGAKLRVVSANDHRHQRKSAHYAGAAIDFQGEKLNELAKWFRTWGYRVLWRVPGHYRHVHVEKLRESDD
mgnify:CR=1 FL=1